MKTPEGIQKKSLRLLILPGLLLGITLLLAISGPDSPLLMALWPPLLALTLVFLTQRAALGLLIGAVSGCLLLSEGAVPKALGSLAFDHTWPALFGTWKLGEPLQELPGKWHLWHLGAIIFTLLLGSLAAVLDRGGGLHHLLIRDSQKNDQKNKFLTRVYGLGILCFFDGLANSLMVGRIARGISDTLKIPRAALAYLVDTTSSAVACVAFLSTWIAIQLTLIQDGISTLELDQPAYLVFLSSIPRNYYCLFALLLAFLVARREWWIGPMRRAEPFQTIDSSSTDDRLPPRASLSSALFPLLTLLCSILLFYYFLHPFYPPSSGVVPPRFPVSVDSVQQALGSNAGPAAFVLGSLLALIVAGIFYPSERRKELPETIFSGMKQMLTPLLVLICAWIFGSLMKSMGTAELIASLLKNNISLLYFPALVFGLACLVSFTTGSSWGTMSLLTPLLLPTLGPMAEAQGLNPEALAHSLPAVVAAIFGGAVFGDHCSPFSDTTIVSALACGISTPHHTVTQLPYALITATLAIVSGYLLEGMGLSPWIGLMIGVSILFVITSIRPDRNSFKNPRPN